MTYQKITTPGGETLIVLPLAEFEEWQDAIDHAKALAAVAAGAETLTQDEMQALLDAPTPLAFWRRKRGITQAALGEAASVSQSYIADIERGARQGDPRLFKRLAAALNVPMENLVAD